MYSQPPKKLAGTQLDPKNICNQLPCDNYLPKTFKHVKLILFTSYHLRNANSWNLPPRHSCCTLTWAMLHSDKMLLRLFRQQFPIVFGLKTLRIWNIVTKIRELIFFISVVISIEKYYRSKCGICPNRRGADKNVLKASRF